VAIGRTASKSAQGQIVPTKVLTRDLTDACIHWFDPVSSLVVDPQSVRARERPVSAEAIMTKTAATPIAISHRTQSIPGLPFPPNAV
jgi:hypothetical protein